MSDDFIPLNESTPVQNKWQNRSQQGSYQNNWQQKNQRRRGYKQQWRHNSQHSNSFGSDSNSSYGRENKTNINAYLHPSMLEDPWAQLRQKSK